MGVLMREIWQTKLSIGDARLKQPFEVALVKQGGQMLREHRRNQEEGKDMKQKLHLSWITWDSVFSIDYISTIQYLIIPQLNLPLPIPLRQNITPKNPFQLHQQYLMSIADFEVISKLGQGAYSSVYKVRRHTDSQLYAIKMVKVKILTQRQKANALNQIRILASLNHPYIVGYREAFIDPDSQSLCIVMEFLNGGDLYQKILDFSAKGEYPVQQWVWNVFIQIVQGLKNLHHHKILHRDLKSANVFLSKSGNAKLGDLNVSKVTRKGFGETQTGTPYYASPEVWKDQTYDLKSDIWSLGCVLYELVTFHPPFRAEDMEGLYKKVIKGSYPKISPYYSKDMSMIIKLMLRLNPQDRPSCDQILNFPYIRKRIKRNWLDTKPKQMLLKTIRVPKDFLSFTEIMPKSNYSRKQRSISCSLPRLLKIKGHSVEIVSGRSSIEKQKHMEKKIELPTIKVKNRYRIG